MMPEVVLMAMTLSNVGSLMMPGGSSSGPAPPTFNIVTVSGETISTQSGGHIRTIQDTP